MSSSTRVPGILVALLSDSSSCSEESSPCEKAAFLLSLVVSDPLEVLDVWLGLSFNATGGGVGTTVATEAASASGYVSAGVGADFATRDGVRFERVVLRSMIDVLDHPIYVNSTKGLRFREYVPCKMRPTGKMAR
jgi:hypothetical protein